VVLVVVKIDGLRIDDGLERGIGEWQRRHCVFSGFVRQPIELPGAVLGLRFGSGQCCHCDTCSGCLDEISTGNHMALL